MPLQNFGVVAPSMILVGKPDCDYPESCTSPMCGSRDSGTILRAAQPDTRGMADLARLTEPFVSYRLSDSNEGPMTLGQEAVAIGCLGGIQVHDPRLGSGFSPNVASIKAVAEGIDFYFRKSPQTVLVHCLHGRERTGAACAAWRLIYGGASLADVEADLAAYGVTGLTALADTLLLDAVRDLAKELGK